LDELAWLGDMRPPGLIIANARLSRPIKAVRSTQNAPHTAETDGDAKGMHYVMPDDFSAAA